MSDSEVKTHSKVSPEALAEAKTEGIIGEHGGLDLPEGMMPHEFYHILQMNMQEEMLLIISWESSILDVALKVKNQTTQETCDISFKLKKTNDEQTEQIKELVKEALDKLAEGASIVDLP